MEVYISTDVETDGPIPGPNSMLSLGAAAFTPDGKLQSTFTVNFETLPGASPDPDTERWWGTQPRDVWEDCRKNPEPPEQAIRKYVAWIRTLDGKPVFVGYPATFDFMFVYHYMIRFLGTGSSPFSFSALDIKSFAMAKLGSHFRETTKRNMPREWFPEVPHTHKALDDAIEQGMLFANILKWQPRK